MSCPAPRAFLAYSWKADERRAGGMSATFRPRLINGRFGDPALFVELAHEREAILFDMGDLGSLSARDLLRIDTVCVSHMHIDHLIGFDRLLRVNVGREAAIRVFGPPGLIDRLGHKLQGYSWDLVDRYDTELAFEVAELHPGESLRCCRFRFSRAFAAEDVGTAQAPEGLVHETPRWHISAREVEHHGPCLAFALEETRRINVWRNRVEEEGLKVGPWLKRLKDAVRNHEADDTPIALPDRGTAPLRELRSLVAEAPGMKIGYATDLRDHAGNRAVLETLMADSDILFIEASFVAADADRAYARAHLTTRAAGEIARECSAKKVEPFHFSPRYEDEEDRLIGEVREAFNATI